MSTHSTDDNGLSRRQFCRAGLVACAGLALPNTALALAKGFDLILPHRQLSFFNTHTGETLRHVDYWADGAYQADALEAINHILRDHRTDQIARIDLRLLDQLWWLNRRLDNNKSLSIISGYRSPQTNDMLRRTGGGVAKHSLHMDGRAIDIRIPGCDLKLLRKTALSLKQGGVGYYPDSQFVHMDTGDIRSWNGS